MADQIATWHAEHVNFARLLDLLEKEVAAFHDGGHPNYDLMGDILYYLRNFCDRFHHPREDVAFERLIHRDPYMAPVVSNLIQEHRVINTMGAQLLERINEVAEDVVIPLAELEAAAATYLVYYRQHLNREESEVMPRAARVLTAEDWEQVKATLPTGPDPLFGPDVDERFQVLRRQLAMEIRISRQQ